MAIRLRRSAGCSALILLLFGSLGLAQSNDDCLMCHSDPDLEGERAGETISVHVDGDAFADSVHGGFACIDCHMDLDGAELPHAEALDPVDCAMCHDEVGQEHADGPHGAWAPVAGSPSAGCVRCHTSHAVRSPSENASRVHRSRVDALCAQCHDDAFEEVSRSSHAGEPGAPGAACVECHSGHGFDAPDLEVEQLERCAACHPEPVRKHRRSLHGLAAVKNDPLAPTCATCHGDHEILPHTDPQSPTTTMNIPLLCGRCHREGSEVSLQKDIPQHRILENFSMSVHGEGLFKKGLTVTAVCTSCHTAHDILDHNHPESSINRDNVAATCQECHARIEDVHVKVIEGRLWEEEPHKIPSCVECHQPHKVRRREPDRTGAADEDCLRCHGKPGYSVERDGETIDLYIDRDRYELTEHGDTACAQCHTDVTIGHPERACATIEEPVDCGICHAEQVSDHERSRHGQLAEAGDEDVPVCLTCHGEPHGMLGHQVPTAPTYPRNVPDLCGQCHASGGVADDRVDTDIPDIVASYLRSTHGRGLMDSGLVVSASCVDCHTAHRPLKSEDPASSVNDTNIPNTCGSCHRGIEEEFKTSIHWPENTPTTEKLPTCEDCHTSHTITRIDAEGFRFRMMDQCGRCHEDYAETFFDTYHGKVTQLGSEGAAKCYDCHGTHNILPTSNPDSTLSRRHVVDTCAQCHPRAHLQFAGYLSHATHHDPERYPYLFYAFWFMTTLLIGTLTFALIHTLMWLFRLWRTREHWRPVKAAAEEGPFYLRFDRKERAMHLVMLLSFFALAITGMALKFSYMGWAQVLTSVLGGSESMGVLHRIGAVALIVLFLYHIRDVIRAKRRSPRSLKEFVFGPDSLMFNLTDIKQVWQSVKWFLGRGPRPQYGRYTYWEKFDYFAVFWGVFVIGSTGLILWFPELFTRMLPGWTVNVATIIHSDEALLAVGFIFTIHFFNTHFRPDKFPMDPVIFTGRVPLAELEHDKPDEYERHIENADPAERRRRIVGPPDPRLVRAARIFGFSALAIGLSLIVLILYAMLFAYK